MCHPLLLTHVDVAAKVESRGVRITATVTTTGPTGVEMEALTAAAVAALTVYDMTKALDKGIEIQDLYLLEKTGGKSGEYNGKASDDPRRHFDGQRFRRWLELGRIGRVRLWRTACSP